VETKVQHGKELGTNRKVDKVKEKPEESGWDIGDWKDEEKLGIGNCRDCHQPFRPLSFRPTTIGLHMSRHQLLDAK
jgi:hypothetical protein